MSPIDIILMSISLAIVAGILWRASVQYRHFRPDSRNPYRRYCLKCLQRQDFYAPSLASERGWWETISPLRDRNCSCHRYTGDGGKWLRD